MLVSLRSRRPILKGKENMNLKQESGAMIELIVGPMFSGKTTELINRCAQAELAGLTLQIFKPAIDTRYAECQIVSHSGDRKACIPVTRPLHVLHLYLPTSSLIAIDEAQLFDDVKELAFVVHTLAFFGKQVLIAGLDTNKWRLSFPWISALGLDLSVKYLTATCTICGRPAYWTQYLLDESDSVEHDRLIDIGGSDKYEPRCTDCHQPYNKRMTKSVN